MPQPSYLLDCCECNQAFESADKWATFCPKCDAEMTPRHTADVGPKITGWTVDMTRKGASREANKILRGEK